MTVIAKPSSQDALGGTFEVEQERLRACLAEGMISPIEHATDTLINIANAVIANTQLDNPAGGLAVSEGLFTWIVSALPDPPPKAKAYLRDREVFMAVCEMYCREHGLLGKAEERIVPRELRKRVRFDRPQSIAIAGRVHLFPGVDAMDFPADVSEIIRHLAANIFHRSPKTIERQYLAFYHHAPKLILRDEESGRIFRDEAYRLTKFLRAILSR